MTTSRSPPNDAERLAFLRACAVLDTPPEPAFDATVELAARVCDTPIATVTFVDERRQWFKARIGLDLTETPRAIAFCDYTVAAAEFVEVQDALADPRFAGNPLVAGEPRIRFYGGAPLVTSSGLVIGTVAVMDVRPRQLEPAQREMLEALARLVMGTLELRHELAERALGAAVDTAEALRKSEAQYRTIVESSPNLICRFTGDTTLTFVNATYCRTFGASRDELIGTRIVDLAAEEDRESVARLLTDLRPDMEPFTHEQLVTLPGGRRRWFQWTDAAVRDDAGRFLEYQGVGRDIDDRKQSELALAESEARFRQLAETIREVFYLNSPRTSEVLYVSPGYERIWGRNAGRLRDNPWDWLEAVHPDDRDRVRAAISNPRNGGNYELEYRLVRPHGEIRWIRDKGFPVFDDRGRVHRVAGVAEDITSRRQLEVALRQRQKLESIGQLAAGVAHDFNNLLTVIQGNVFLLQERFTAEGDPGEPGALLAQVAGAADRAAALTRQLLLFSRKEHLQPRLLDLNDQCRHLAGLLERTLGEEVELRLELVDRPTPVQADAGMIDQVITNLVLNARDAMPRGGVVRVATGTSDLSAEEAAGVPDARPGRFVCATVTDTGTGIRPEDMPHLFEPFFTTKEAGSGTGLGLATAYGIVTQHRGWIEVASELGEGTTIAVFLPLAEPAAESAGPIPAPAIPGGTETVLLVEDEPGLRDLADRVLRDRGYEILPAANGIEGLSVWQSRSGEVDLLITDLVLPGGLRGQELAVRCREDRPELKVLYMSGYRGELEDPGLDLGGNSDFLQKPFRPSQLLSAVRALLDRESEERPPGR